MSLIRPVSVEPLSGYRIHIRFADGTEGIIDLSPDVGQGVFAPLTDETFFRTVHLGSYGQIAWSEEIEICPDAAYAEVAGHTSVEVIHAGS